MGKRNKVNDLFCPIVPEERLHPRFKHVRDWKGAEPSRLMINEIFGEFDDPEGNFVEQFQTGAFDARIFELYLFAYLTRSGYRVQRNHAQPDFIATRDGITVAIEATTVNPRVPQLASTDLPPPPELSAQEIEKKLNDELPIRFGSPLFSRLKKKYWELPHCNGLPFVIAVEAFHERYSFRYTDSLLTKYAYGLRNLPKWTKSGKLVVDYEQIHEHHLGEKVIPSNFFGQPDTEHVSAILCTNSGTWPKFVRMGYQAGYHRGNLGIVRRGTCFNPDADSATPCLFAYDLDTPPCPEHWGQGIVILHNPNAKHPLPRDYFVDAAALYLEGNKLTADTPRFHPFSSVTLIVLKEDPDLDPFNEARKSIRSLLKKEFEQLGTPERRGADIIGEEKEWFSSTDGGVVGTVIRDRQDDDFLYVVFVRSQTGEYEAEDLRIDLKSRERAREMLLDSMETFMQLR